MLKLNKHSFSFLQEYKSVAGPRYKLTYWYAGSESIQNGCQ